MRSSQVERDTSFRAFRRRPRQTFTFPRPCRPWSVLISFRIPHQHLECVSVRTSYGSLASSLEYRGRGTCCTSCRSARSVRRQPLYVFLIIFQRKSVISRDTVIVPRKLDWMVLDRAEDLKSIMSDNATFVQFPPIGSSASLITVFGDHRVNVQRTIRSIMQLVRPFLFLFHIIEIWDSRPANTMSPHSGSCPSSLTSFFRPPPLTLRK